jgi:hypothetical protein
MVLVFVVQIYVTSFYFSEEHFTNVLKACFSVDFLLNFKHDRVNIAHPSNLETVFRAHKDEFSMVVCVIFKVSKEVAIRKVI